MSDLNEPEKQSRIQKLIQALKTGDQQLIDELFVDLYGLLIQRAKSHLRSERPGNSYNTEDLVNEAILKTIGKYFPGRKTDNVDVPDFENTRHFVNLVGRKMKNLLIDESRRPGKKVTLLTGMLGESQSIFNEPEFEEALERLEEFYPKQSMVLVSKFFVGLRSAEIANLLEVEERTVNRYLKAAVVFLRRELDSIKADHK